MSLSKNISKLTEAAVKVLGIRGMLHLKIRNGTMILDYDGHVNPKQMMDSLRNGIGDDYVVWEARYSTDADPGTLFSVSINMGSLDKQQFRFAINEKIKQITVTEI